MQQMERGAILFPCSLVHSTQESGIGQQEEATFLHWDKMKGVNIGDKKYRH